MASRAQILRLASKLDALTTEADPIIRVICYLGETPEFAKQRHLQIRPDHVGRRMKLEQRQSYRDSLAELIAAHTQEELEAAVEAASNKGVSAQLRAATAQNRAE